MNKKRVVIKTSRQGVVLKQFIPEDAKPLFRLIDCNRGHLSQREDGTAEKYPDLESVLKSITHPTTLTSKLRLGIWENDTLVGTINLRPLFDILTTTREVGYWVGSDFCGRGLATISILALAEYAFCHMEISTLTARVRNDNTSSLRVLEKAGFSFACVDYEDESWLWFEL